MSTPIKKPPLVNTTQDPGLEYLNQREIEVAITPTENPTKGVVYEEVTQVITNVFQVNAPIGANGQLQFNQNGQYVGDTELQYDPNTDTLTTGKIVANTITITGNASSLKLNGGYNNDVLKTDGTGNLSWGNVFPSVAGNTGKFLVTNGVSINWSNVNYNSLATTTFVSSAIANLVGTAPAMLDTLGEIANIIGQTNDPQYGIISQLANKANISNLAQVAFSGSYSDLSYKPTISTAGRTGNYADLNGKPTIPATINDLGISDGSNGQVLTTYGNGKYHFTTVTSGSNANIGNIGFDDNIIYSNTGIVINNSDLGNVQTAGMAIPVQGDGNAVSLYNSYGNVTILAGNIGNSQPVQSWTFNSAGALFFPQTPYVTSGIVVDDNNQELSIGTDRGNISIWPENSKWLFSADGTTTFPNNVISQHTGINLSVATSTASSMSTTITNSGSGYGNGGSQSATSGGSGTGLTVSYGYGMQGQVSNIGILNPGSGYQDGDVLTMTAGNGNATFILHIVPQINNSWTFGADGNLTLPSNTSKINYANGTSILGGGGASTGNWEFRNDTIYNYAGGQINNGDETHGATSGLVLPDNGNIGAVTTLFNNYGNVVLTSGEIVTTDNTIGTNGYQFYTDINLGGGFGVIDGWHQRNPQEIEVNIFTAQAPIWSVLIGASLGATVIVTYSTPSGNQTFTSVLSQQFTGQGQVDPNHDHGQRYSGRIDGTLPVGQTGIISINFPTSSVTNKNWVFGQDGGLSLPGGAVLTSASDTLVVNDNFSIGAYSSETRLQPSHADANVEIATLATGSIDPSIWTFGTNGSLTIPGGGAINNDGSTNTINIVGSNYASMQSHDNYIWVEETYAAIAVNDYEWTFHDDAVLTIANGANISQTTDNGGQKTFNITPPDTSDFEVVTVDGDIRLQTANSYGVGTTSTWTLDKDGNLSLPQGTILSETANSTAITPPNALAGQGLVVRLTGAQGISSDHPGGFTDGDTITLTIVPDYNLTPVTGTVDFTFTGCTSQQLGRALTGTLTFTSEPSKLITWTIPVSSTMTTFTITLSNAVGFSIGGLISPLTLTRSGSSEDHHVHLIAGDPSITDMYLGDDDQYVKIEKNGGNVIIGTNANNNQWTFDTGGKLTLPQGSQISETAGVSTNITVNGHAWAFDVNGNLTLPTGGNLIVSGSIVSNGASPAPSISGFDSISGLNFNADNNITANGNILANSVYTDNYYYANGAPLAIPSGNTSVTTTGNVTAGNVIAGNFSGNGNQLTSIAGANVRGTVANATYATSAGTASSVAVANVSGIGNIATINKDGNASNILYGNGVFAASPASGNVSKIANGNSNVNIANSNSSVTITANGIYTWTFGANGSTTLANGGYVNMPNTGAWTSATDDGSNYHMVFNTLNDFRIQTAGGAWQFGKDGNLAISAGNLTLDNGQITTTYSPASTSGSAILARGANTQGGTGYFDFLKVTNQSGNATNPNKTLRVNSTGALEIINSLYTSIIFSLTDSGNVTIPGNLNVLGTTTTVNTANLTVSNALITLANSSTTPIQANGGGIQLNGANANIIYTTGNDGWNMNKPLAVTGSISTTGSLVGASSNVSLVAGSYTTTFDNTGNTTFANGTVSLTKLTASGNANVGNLGTSGLITATGNLNAGNVITAGIVSATGNVTGNFFIGNGSQLTGIDATAIQNGTANVRTFSSANVTISASGNANVLVVTGTGANISGTANVSGNLSAGNVSATTFTGALSGAATTAGTITTNAQPNITSVGTLTSLAVTGNITNGNVTGGNLVSANYFTGTLTTAAQPNITSTGTLTSLSVTGNVSAGNVIVNGQPTTYGYVNGAYLLAQNNADQSAGQNVAINFQTTSASNGSIINKISNTQVTLTAGNTYKLEAIIRRMTSSSTWGQFRWYDVTNSAYIGIEGFSEVVTSAVGVGSTIVATAYVTPSVNNTYELRQTTYNTVTVSGNFATIEITQVNPTIAVQATATGTVSKNYAKYVRTTAQTVSAGAVVICSTLESSSGTAVSVNTSTGQVTLTAGTYRLRGTVGSFSGYAAAAMIGYSWYNETTSAYIGEGAGFNGPTSTAWNASSGGTAEAVITVASTTVVSFRVVSVSNTSSIGGTGADFGAPYAYPWIDIEQMGATFALNALDTISTTGNVTVGGNLTVTGNITGNIASRTTGSWTVTAGAGTYSLTVPINGTYSIWVNGNIPNGIITYTATAVVTNTNVPVLGTSYGWYYAAGNALVLTSIPTQFVGTVNNISNAVVSTTTANVFTFGITNNSGSSQVVNWGYTKL